MAFGELVEPQDISAFTAQDLRFDRLNDRLVLLPHNITFYHIRAVKLRPLGRGGCQVN